MHEKWVLQEAPLSFACIDSITCFYFPISFPSWHFLFCHSPFVGVLSFVRMPSSTPILCSSSFFKSNVFSCITSICEFDVVLTFFSQIHGKSLTLKAYCHVIFRRSSYLISIWLTIFIYDWTFNFFKGMGKSSNYHLKEIKGSGVSYI